MNLHQVIRRKAYYSIHTHRKLAIHVDKILYTNKNNHQPQFTCMQMCVESSWMILWHRWLLQSSLQFRIVYRPGKMPQQLTALVLLDKKWGTVPNILMVAHNYLYPVMRHLVSSSNLQRYNAYSWCTDKTLIN